MSTLTKLVTAGIPFSFDGTRIVVALTPMPRNLESFINRARSDWNKLYAAMGDMQDTPDVIRDLVSDQRRYKAEDVLPLNLINRELTELLDVVKRQVTNRQATHHQVAYVITQDLPRVIKVINSVLSDRPPSRRVIQKSILLISGYHKLLTTKYAELLADERKYQTEYWTAREKGWAQNYFKRVRAVIDGYKFLLAFLPKILSIPDHAGYKVNYETFQIGDRRDDNKYVEPGQSLPGPGLSNKTETMYRADITAHKFVGHPELFGDFYAKRERVFGGGTPTGRVSVTYDKKVAFDFVRMWRVLWLIAHGKVTMAQVIRWFKDSPKNWEEWKNNVDLRQYLSNPNDRLSIAKAYNVFVWAVENHRNPVMWGIDEYMTILKKVPYNGIGVLTLTIDVEKADIKRLPRDHDFLEVYALAEAEYRIKPEGVLKVDRLS